MSGTRTTAVRCRCGKPAVYDATTLLPPWCGTECVARHDTKSSRVSETARAIPGAIAQRWHDELEELSRRIGRYIDDVNYGATDCARVDQASPAVACGRRGEESEVSCESSTPRAGSAGEPSGTAYASRSAQERGEESTPPRDPALSSPHVINLGDAFRADEERYRARQAASADSSGATPQAHVAGVCGVMLHCPACEQRPSETARSGFADGFRAGLEKAVEIADQEARICKRQASEVPARDRMIHRGGECIATTIAARLRGLFPDVLDEKGGA